MAMGNFTAQLAGFEKKAATQIKAVVQKIGMEAFSRIIMKSPVDTGRFRANWGVQIGAPYVGITDLTDKPGSTTQARMTGDVLQWNAQGSIFLCNNLPYSIALEYGHSQRQAPAGMVRTTAAEMNGVAESVARAMS